MGRETDISAAKSKRFFAADMVKKDFQSKKF